MANTKMSISKDIFNKAYLPYLQDYNKRFSVFYGGAGSGKSVFITQNIFLYKKDRFCM